MDKFTADTSPPSQGAGVVLKDQGENYDPPVPSGSGTAHNAVDDPKAKVSFGPTAEDKSVFKSCRY